jgi:histidinol dehydrogenase
LGVGNLSTISAAIGASNSPAEAIRNVRNFYAHRTMETAEKAMKTGYFTESTRPIVFDLASYATGGKTVIESWVLELWTVASAAIE